ncbi:autotransporter outer membrane beta-barrel domain-containing protein [Paraburkholderia antibiotica]|uniref:autotransporter outer membrane beta-barrel domain-containing protein n=1 Tax=Paraburkholderia antibiotica TaxID=2728839 RepID=UPI001E4AB421|nr:autotransporter domain-containing protein [Paraburkholderia antibiotica]
MDAHARYARDALPARLSTRHKRLNRLSILHAIWLLGVSSVTASAQTVTELTNLSGSGLILVPANTALVVGTDGTNTSFSGTISSAGTATSPTAEQGAFIKTGAGTLTIDGAAIRGGSAFVVGGGLAVTSGNATIDYLSLGINNATLTGSTSSGVLSVSGGTLTFNNALHVGDFGGTGTVTQTGGNVVFGAPGVSLNIGNQGGTGTYNLSGGTVTVGTSTTNNFVTLGRNTQGNPASSGTLNLSGGTFNLVGGTLFIGSNQSGSTGTGTINQTGGTLAVGSGSALYLAAAGNGTYNLSGGTLQIGGSSLSGDYNSLGGTYAFNLGGGTIQVIGSALSANVDATLVGGTTSTIDTNGIGATWSGVLSGGGALAKAGNGTLTLTNANTYTGLTTIAAGTLALTGNGSINSTSGMVNNGTFDISGVTTAIVPLPNLSGGGAIIDGTNTLVVGIDGTSTVFSGMIVNTGAATNSQHGSFVKTGAGLLTIDGATIRGGSAFVVGGGLALTSGNTTIDYLSLGLGNALAAQVPGSTLSGTLGVSGGTLTFNNALQVGDFGGTGTVNQTGGNVVFGTPGVALNIGNQGGTGTYNLAGGTVTFGTATTDFVTLGRNASSSTSSSGTLNLSGGTFNLANGALFIGSNLASPGGGTGTINQTGGVFAVGNASRLYLAAVGSGTYNLAGGTLQIGGSSLSGDYNNLGGTYAFNLGGGTIQVVGPALSTDVNATLMSGTTSTIDTNGIGATWSGVLSGSGALTKAGAGVLTLSGANTYSGGTALNAGTLSPGNATALGTGTLAMAANTTLDFGNSFTLNNAVRLSGDPTVNVNSGLTGTLSGTLSDGTASGDLVKTGSGNLVLSAVNTYTGATTISAGTLALAGAGSISQSSGVTANGTFDISGAAADESIRSLSGAGNVALGARTLTLTAASGDFGGTIAGGGGLTLAAGLQRLSGTNTYTGGTNVQGGQLQVDGALVNSAVTVGRGGTLLGTGSVAGATISGGGTIAPGHSVGTLTVNGAYSQLAGSTYAAQLGDGLAASDRITVNGQATLANGAILEVSGPPSGVILPTARYTVLTAADGVSGTYTLAGDTAISAFYRLADSYDANNVYLSAQQVRQFAAAALTPNQRAAAGALDSLAAGSALRAAIGELPTDAAARGAFDQLSGEIHASAKTVLLEQSSATRDAATDRLRDAYCGVGASEAAIRTAAVNPRAGDTTCNPQDTVVWTRGFGSWGSISGDGNAARISQSIGGVFVGADTPVFGNWRAGLFGGYDHSTFDADERMSSGSSDDYHLGVYGGSQWGALGLRLGASYSWHRIGTSRAVAFDGYVDHLDASYDAGTAQVFGELGYRFDVNNVKVEPFANLAYVNLHVDRFGEQGNAAALTASGDTINMAYSTLGARASTALMLGRITLVVNGSLGWRHAYGNSTPTSVLALRGSMPFNVAGVPVTRDSAVMSAGVGTALTRNLSARVSYNGQFGSGFRDQGIFGDLAWRF